LLQLFLVIFSQCQPLTAIFLLLPPASAYLSCLLKWSLSNFWGWVGWPRVMILWISASGVADYRCALPHPAYFRKKAMFLFYTFLKASTKKLHSVTWHWIYPGSCWLNHLLFLPSDKHYFLADWPHLETQEKKEMFMQLFLVCEVLR
jgi:hypothetical protein